MTRESTVEERLERGIIEPTLDTGKLIWTALKEPVSPTQIEIARVLYSKDLVLDMPEMISLSKHRLPQALRDRILSTLAKEPAYVPDAFLETPQQVEIPVEPSMPEPEPEPTSWNRQEADPVTEDEAVMSAGLLPDGYPAVVRSEIEAGKDPDFKQITVYQGREIQEPDPEPFSLYPAPEVIDVTEAEVLAESKQPIEPAWDRNLYWWSPSRLSCYLDCGESFRLRYVEKVKTPGSASMIVGSSVHAGIEAALKQYRENQTWIGADDLAEFGAMTLTEKAAEEGVAIEDSDKAQVDGTLRGLDLSQVRPTVIEWQFHVPMGPWGLTGYIDLIDEVDGVVDWKTSKKSKTEDEADKSAQLTVYAIAHQAQFGSLPPLRLRALVWGSKGLKVQDLSTTRTAEQCDRLLDVIDRVDGYRIAGVAIPATPGHWKCSPGFCGYWDRCKVRWGR